MPIYALGDVAPTISSSAYVHPDAVVIGDVTIDDEASVWPTAVLRGDYGPIAIGARTSIQDGTIVHCIEDFLTSIGADCVVGHNAYLEGCTVEAHCLIGSGALVLNYVHVETGAVVAAGAVVREKATVNANTIVAGIPATERGSAEAVAERINRNVDMYLNNAKRYRAELRRID